MNNAVNRQFKLAKRPVGMPARDTWEYATVPVTQPGEGEMLADLIVAAHADAKRKLDAAQAETMKAVAGPLAGLPGFPKF